MRISREVILADFRDTNHQGLQPGACDQETNGCFWMEDFSLAAPGQPPAYRLNTMFKVSQILQTTIR
jgi:hypothetical protein